MGAHRLHNNNLRVVQFDNLEHQQLEQSLQQAVTNLTAWVHELEQRIYEIDLLSELDDRLQSCTSAEEALALSARFLRQFFRNESGTLYFFDPGHRCPRTIATWGDPVWQQRSFIPERCWAVQHHHEQDHPAYRPPASCFCQDQPVQPGSICVPIVVLGETVGLLQVQSRNQATDNQPDSGIAILPEYKQRLAFAGIELLALALEKFYHHEIEEPVPVMAFEKQVEL